MALYAKAANSSSKSVDSLLNDILHEPTPLSFTRIPLNSLRRTQTLPPRIRPQIDDLYNENRAPTLQYLLQFNTVNLTDEEGHRYWLVEDVKINRGFVEAVMNSDEFRPDDIMLWVRPKVAVTEEDKAMKRGNPFILPAADIDLPVTFFHSAEGAERRLQGYIVMTGGDAPQLLHSRQSSYVVIRDLKFA
jgi:hypothetical protein